MTLPVLCIYHYHCADGFAAAWVVRKYLGSDQVGFHPGVYGEPPPDVTGRNVVIVDFSYKRPLLDELAKSANSILILDHHKTAAEDLAGILTPPSNYAAWERATVDGRPLSLNVRMTALFDMDRSGAGMAWDFFFPEKPRPRLLDHIEDRDLWRFRLPRTREIQANLFSYAYDFATWDHLFANAQSETGIEYMADQGAAIERKHMKDIAELLVHTARPMVIGGVTVQVANLPYTMASDAAGRLAEGAPFGACYFDRADGKRMFSLRSRDGGMDVSEIAKAYGGGGHRNASGFQAPEGWTGDQQ